jgi:hypothetical protein
MDTYNDIDAEFIVVVCGHVMWSRGGAASGRRVPAPGQPHARAYQMHKRWLSTSAIPWGALEVHRYSLCA